MGRMRSMFGVACLSLGLVLMNLNLYGLTRDLRPDGLVPPHLRFGERDLRTELPAFKAGVERRADESDERYVERLTQVIADGLAHVHWKRYDPDRFHQRVPVWENYILYLMGVITPIPEFERYHFSSVEKSMERGIGICGDASILMSQLLSRERIENEIINFPGHIVIEATVGGEQRVYDPDFGVVLSRSAQEMIQSPGEAVAVYEASGFAAGEVAFLNRAFEEGFRRWQGPEHFITKKFYFEKVAYFLKWGLPLLLLLTVVFLCRPCLPLRFRPTSSRS